MIVQNERELESWIEDKIKKLKNLEQEVPKLNIEDMEKSFKNKKKFFKYYIKMFLYFFEFFTDKNDIIVDILETLFDVKIKDNDQVAITNENKMIAIKNHFLYKEQSKILYCFNMLIESNKDLKKQIKEFKVFLKKEKEEFLNEKKVILI